MSQFEKTISNLIASQFPQPFQEEGPVLVEFIKAYYEWMETEDGPLHHSRRLLDYRDLDTTVDSFLIHFKNKYLNGIQLNTAVETSQVIKHALDMYRSKGTERSIDLFFRNLFGVAAEIYYPGDDMFRTSDGIWVVPRYLEIQAFPDPESFIGFQVEGIESGATAYIEKYVTKRHKGTSRYAYIYYINRPVGRFLKGEKLKAAKSGAIGPVVLGSMSELNVISSSSGYRIGDVVDVSSFRDGIDGRARVSSILTSSGKISFKLESGGWGYKSNSQIIISEKVLTVNSAVYAGRNFELFETLVQPKSTVTFSNASSNVTAGMVAFRIDDSNGFVYSSGIVLEADASSNQITISISGGQTDDYADMLDESGAPIYTENGLPFSLDGTSIGPTHLELVSPFVGLSDIAPVSTSDYANVIAHGVGATANVVSWIDTSAYGNVMAYSANLNLTVVANSITRFANGDSVYQLVSGTEVANGFVLAASEGVGGTTAMRILSSEGTFTVGTPILSRTSTASGTVNDVSTTVGVYDIEGDFSSVDGNYIVCSVSGVEATVTRVSRGSGAVFEISNTFSYVENIEVNTDKIVGYSDIELDSSDYGLPAPGAESQSTVLGDAMTFVSGNVGKITSIIVKNDGSDYDTVPFVLVYDHLSSSDAKKDSVLRIDNPTGEFSVGEPLRQDGIERGIVKSGSNSTFVFAERISMSDFVPNSDITGVLTGFTANVLSADVDFDSENVGMNAVIVANTAVGAGVVSGLEVIDSGYNYRDFETVTFSKDGLGVGTAEARLTNQGFSEGYYKENRSALSSDKYLQDGEYYQEYSYEIRSPIALEKYEDILRRIVHMAGTKHFSRYQLRSSNDMAPVVESTTSVESF